MGNLGVCLELKLAVHVNSTKRILTAVLRPGILPLYLQLLHGEKDVRGAHSLLPFKFNRENRGIVLEKKQKKWLEAFLMVFVSIFCFITIF